LANQRELALLSAMGDPSGEDPDTVAMRKLMELIRQKEGSESPESANQKFALNNPGHLKFAGQVGAVPTGPRDEEGRQWAQFPNEAAGASALAKQLGLYGKRGLSLNDAMAKYAPPQENDTQAYINNISSGMGVSPQAKMAEILRGGGQINPQQAPAPGAGQRDFLASLPNVPPPAAGGGPQMPQMGVPPADYSNVESLLNQGFDPNTYQTKQLNRNPQVSDYINKLVGQLMQDDDEVIMGKLQSKFPGKWGTAKRVAMDLLLGFGGTSLGLQEKARMAEKRKQNDMLLQRLTALQNQEVQYNKEMEKLSVNAANMKARDAATRATAAGRIMNWKHDDAVSDIMSQAKLLQMQGQLDESKMRLYVAGQTGKKLAMENALGDSKDAAYQYATHTAFQEVSAKYGGIDPTSPVAPPEAIQDFQKTVLEHAKAWEQMNGVKGALGSTLREGPTIFNGRSLEQNWVRTQRDPVTGEIKTTLVPVSTVTGGFRNLSKIEAQQFAKLETLSSGFDSGYTSGLQALAESKGDVGVYPGSGYFSMMTSTFRNAGWLGGPGETGELFNRAMTTKTVSDLIFQYSGKQTTERERQFFMLMMPSLQQRLDVQMTYNLLRGTAIKVELMKLAGDPRHAAVAEAWKRRFGVTQNEAIQLHDGDNSLLLRALMVYTHAIIGTKASPGRLLRAQAIVSNASQHTPEDVNRAKSDLERFGKYSPSLGDIMEYAAPYINDDKKYNAVLDDYEKKLKSDQELVGTYQQHVKENPAYTLSAIGRGVKKDYLPTQ
jgi:hypothetical protein